MKEKYPHTTLKGLLAIVALFLFTAFWLLATEKPQSSVRPTPDTLGEVLELCGISLALITGIEEWDVSSEVSYPQMDALLNTPVIAEYFNPSNSEIGVYTRVQLLDTGSNRETMPQIMYFETPDDDFRVFAKVYRGQHAEDYCGTFELGRNG
jgi:hypothetical protein